MNSEFLKAIKEVGETYVSVFSKNLGSAQKRCLIFEGKNHLSITRDGLTIAQHLKWKTGAAKLIHTFIEKQVAYKLRDNSTSFFLLIGHLLLNPTKWEEIVDQLKSIYLGEPIYTRDALFQAINNSVKSSLYPIFIPFVDKLVDTLMLLPKEIATHPYLPYIFQIQKYILPHMPNTELELFFHPNKQYFPFKSQADFERDLSDQEIAELSEFFNVSSRADLIITSVKPAIIEVTAKSIASPAHRLDRALWYLDAAQACDQSTASGQAMASYYGKGAARMAGLNGTLYCTGFYAQEYALLLEDGIYTAVQALNGGCTTSLAGHCAQNNLPILKEIISTSFNPLYIEGYNSAHECIQLVVQCADYFFNSTFIQETWDGF